ncbi:hypothetical protein KIW84_041412 [Lathyrus oleraceus]|uniref:DUF7745 domain-containing protein n=1 Tax=Pisum sativum TaxID=3888 RepID=A0A9D4X850_PEA|nr:hypothetical protein KIW84_041412 [Pisum sativum]
MITIRLESVSLLLCHFPVSGQDRSFSPVKGNYVALILIPDEISDFSGDDGDISFHSVYFGTPSRICGYSVPQMVVISSEVVTRCSGTFLIEILVERLLHSNMRPGLKDDVVYSFFDPEISVLKEMIALMTPDHVGMFREAYGGILKLVFRLTDTDRSVIHTLLQFYDLGLRCFVFPDYLLGPLMEDYASILGIQIRDQIPFYVTKGEPDVVEISRALYLSTEVTKGGLKEKGKFPGFHLSFLEAKAKEHAVVDINAIRLFVQRNPIPTLVGDVYYSVHNRNEKRRGGLIRCCAQLLYKWFMGYLPSRGAFVFLDPTVNWETRLMGLRAKDIAWTHNGVAGRDFIYSCGSFPNVTLIGVQGWINYNPTLLRR